MRIAQIAPLCEAVPPKLYGGTERVVAHLANALVDLGHDVTLFASADSTTRASLVAMRDQALRLDRDHCSSELAAHLAMLHEVRRRAADFDLLHFHVEPYHLPMFEPMADRTVTTMHGRLDLKDLPALYRCWPQYPLVSISNSQRRPLPQANWLGTVYHGFPLDLHQPSYAPAGTLVFLGRISPEKRPDRAIEIAKRAGMRLKIAAKVDDADRAYFHERIEPLLDHPLIEWLGEVDDTQKTRLLGDAAALLFPIDWPEPFGLVLIEAMACGTPVIAWPHGSVPELVDDGVTGFIVDTIDAAVHALARIEGLDRRRIRAVFEQRFSSAVMAQNYTRIYWRLLSGERLLETA